MSISEEAAQVTRETDAQLTQMRQWVMRATKAGLMALGVFAWSAGRTAARKAGSRWDGHGSEGIVSLNKVKASDSPTGSLAWDFDQADEWTRDFARLLARYHVPVAIGSDSITNRKCIYYNARDTQTIQATVVELLHDHGFTPDMLRAQQDIADGRDVSPDMLGLLSGHEWTRRRDGTLEATCRDDSGVEIVATVPRKGQTSVVRRDEGAATILYAQDDAGETQSQRAVSMASLMDSAVDRRTFEQERSKAVMTPRQMSASTRGVIERHREEAARASRSRQKPLLAHQGGPARSGQGRGV